MFRHLSERHINELPDEMTGYQLAAWVMWRSRAAVDMFSGAEAPRLWQQVKRGVYPSRLGTPTAHVSPAEAERRILDDSEHLLRFMRASNTQYGQEDAPKVECHPGIQEASSNLGSRPA